jgi:sulfoxide reductase catalytic subunit YedY
MAHFHRSPDWHDPELKATPEDVYWNRRKFIRRLGLGTIGSATLPWWAPGSGGSRAWGAAAKNEPTLAKLDVQRNDAFKLDRPITDEAAATHYNNFYEYTTNKQFVWRMSSKLKVRPWQLEIAGMVNKPMTIDVDELIKKMKPHTEERLYRFRCVETWAMAVPWVGFPIKAVMDLVEPLESAKYVTFETFMRPDQAPAQKTETHLPWPYTEGLTLQEAANDLAILAIGIYGKEMPTQNGAPIRLICPWKYGFKSGKSIVKIEFTDQQPKTFWNLLAPNEYGFFANVNPQKPHPRWSQAEEWLIDTQKRVPTQLYNGYADQVAKLYTGKEY